MRGRSLLLAVTALTALAGCGVASAASLADAIDLAYQTNPSLLASRAELRALDERYVQALDALGPTASISAQHTVDAAHVQQPASIFSPAGTVYDRATNTSAQVSVNQPIYSQGQLSTAISAARADVMSGRQTLRQQEAVVLNQVIAAYADTLMARGLLAIAEQDVAILRAELVETQAKVDIKSVTLTDRAQARSRLVAAQVKLTQSRAGLADAEAKYLAVVGAPAGQLDPLPDLPGTPPNVDAAFDAAERANPQLLAATYAEMASRARIAQAKAADGLQVSLSASVARQPAAPYLQNQDVTSVIGSVVFNKPLFTSGTHQSRVVEAEETNNRDDLKVADAHRQTILAVAQAWNDLAARREVLTGLREQIIEEARAFKGARIEERVGLRTTLDVLNAEQELQAAKVSLVQGYRDEYLSRVNLMAAVGVLQAELIDPGLEPYKPEASLHRRTALSRALPWEALIATFDSFGAPRIAPNPSPRDPLGAQRPGAGPLMPPAPLWSDLAPLLNDDSDAAP